MIYITPLNLDFDPTENINPSTNLPDICKKES